MKSAATPSLHERKHPTTTEIETVGSDACPLGLCDGSGQIKYVEREPETVRRPIGGGLELGPMVTHGTHLCRCRWEAEPRVGDARWWTSRSVYSAEWESSVHRHEGEIMVRGEVPVSDENFIVHRTGENFYYPTTIDLDFDQDWLHSLFPDEARDLAAKLVAAADAADAYDEVPDAA